MAYIVEEVTALVLALRCGVTLALAAAACGSARRALADFEYSRETRAGAEAAARRDPDNAAYALAAAAWRDAAREDSVPELRRASAIAPLDERVIQKLALALEMNGDTAGAEQQLLRAAARSKKYDPSWALANFYFRQGRGAEFRRWTREALAMSYGDPAPLFDLAWEIDPASGVPFDDLPPRRDVRLAYGNFLVRHQRMDLAARVAAGLGAGQEPEARLLAEALAADYRLAEAERIAPGHATRWTGDRAHSSDGAWRIHLDGEQPEQTELLSRLAIVRAGRVRLTWSMRTALTSPAGALKSSGLRWRVSAWSTGGGVITESDDVAPSGEGGGTLDFTLERESAVRISLEYRRPPGAMRAEGSIAVMSAETGPAP